MNLLDDLELHSMVEMTQSSVMQEYTHSSDTSKMEVLIQAIARIPPELLPHKFKTQLLEWEHSYPTHPELTELSVWLAKNPDTPQWLLDLIAQIYAHQ